MAIKKRLSHPDACMLLSVIQQLCHEIKDSDDQASDWIASTHHLLTKWEHGHDLSAYEDINSQILHLLLQWVAYKKQHDNSAADQTEKEIEHLAKEQAFPYALTLKLFDKYNYPPRSSYEEAKNYYRPPRYLDPDNYTLDNGMIKGKLPSRARIGVIGDWGTGTSDAIYLLDDMLTRAPDLDAIIHLGDIYAAGLPYECIVRFKQAIEDVFKHKHYPPVPVFTLAGNHEYICGGKGYFPMLDVLNEQLDPKWQQKTSYFALRSACNSWQIVGADTGIGSTKYDPKSLSSTPGIEPDEVVWIKRVIQLFPGKTIFLTHHPFVSSDIELDGGGKGDIRFFNTKLLDMLWSEINKIELWLWGHDHWFSPFIKNLPVPVKSAGQAQTLFLHRGVLLGGSARETEQSEHKVLYKKAVERDKKGHFVLPEITQSGLYNHTYAIIDLGRSHVEYFQTPAWFGDETKPDIHSIQNPLFRHAL